ncbi:WD40-repeat-containing domain protein [Cokeromyces recurvatus]|uniref:WD40-repeat-containing domain protein n=1 Tax=Cokeromyces recurvatus TaxID=90255 RepID=UPI0022205483|nr:WD40-repeat-containing domain protein [Cokeromyces recurvatus]KAI7897631.1 WD40-repeat-containing domain protein [Cokeromyces recurvatus]
MDKVLLDYMSRVKSTFQQLSSQQRHSFLIELLHCCDNQLLQIVYAWIIPKLKIDFFKELPKEIALHIISFLDEPQTLIDASLVSRHWNSLLKDDTIWKSLCIKYHYHHLSSSSSSSNNNNSNGHQQPPFLMTTDHYQFFRRHYHIETAWNQGRGRMIPCCEVTHLMGLVTSMQMNEDYIVIGCDNNRIDVFDTRTGHHLRSLSDHEGGIWALQFIKTSVGYVLVTGGCDRVTRVWDLDTGELKYRLRGHISTIRCLKICDEKVAITGSRDTTLHIWDIDQGQLRHVCTGHQGSVRCIDVYGNYLVSGSYDTTARLWDIERGECVYEFVGHHSQIYSIAFDGSKVVTGSLDSNIRVWSAKSGECLATLYGHTSLVGQLQLLDHTLVSGGSDGCLRVWDMNTYECKHRISAHDNSVTCLQFDKKRILSGGSDGEVKLWDMKTGTLLRTFIEPAKSIWKLQMIETKAVIVMERKIQHHTQQPYQIAIELYDFDLLDDTMKHN